MTRRTLVGVLLALAFVTPLTARAAARLETRIAIDKTSLTTADEVMVRFSLTNSGDARARVLRWETPVFGVDADLFEVALNGEPVAYLGRLVKRPAPQATDYVGLEPGETVSVPVPLSSLYDFSRPGEYTVRYRVSRLNPFPRDRSDATIDVLSSNMLTLWLEGDDLSEVLWNEPPADEPDFVTPQFVNCSSSRQTSIRNGLSGSQTYTGNALGYLNAGTVGARYTTWFGSYTSSRYSTVRSHFSALDSTVRTKTIRFNCGCTDSAYAYVYPNQPYTIYLCNAFWSAPTTGTDSKAGTIVHELSHFYVVASTDDWAYGQSACKSLARSRPSRAIDNADSHEYFAENTPFQN